MMIESSVALYFQESAVSSKAASAQRPSGQTIAVQITTAVASRSMLVASKAVQRGGERRILR
jgi:hypothetical protein